VAYTPHEGDVTCSRCGASAVVAPRTGKIVKNDLRVFERGENLLHNGTLCLDSVNHQKLRLKVRIYADEKPTILKGIWHLKG